MSMWQMITWLSFLLIFILIILLLILHLAILKNKRGFILNFEQTDHWKYKHIITNTRFFLTTWGYFLLLKQFQSTKKKAKVMGKGVVGETSPIRYEDIPQGLNN